MRVTSLIDANSADAISKTTSSSSEGNSSFQKILGSTSDVSSESGRQVHLLAGSRIPTDAQRGAKLHTRAEARDNDSNAGNVRTKGNNHADKRATPTQSRAISQTTLQQEYAVTASAPTTAGALPIQASDADRLGELAVADDVAIGSGMIAGPDQREASTGVPLTGQDVAKALDSSTGAAEPSSYSAEEDCKAGAMKPTSSPDPSASSTQDLSKGDGTPVTIADAGSSSLSGTTASVVGGDAPLSSIAVVTPPLVATANASSSSIPNTAASPSGTDSVQPGTAVMTSPPAPDSQPSAGSIGSASVELSPTSKTGGVSVKSTVDEICSGHITKLSSAPDHDGKHKTNSNSRTGSMDSHDGDTTSALVATVSTSNSSGESQSDTQKAPTADLTAAQQQGAAVGQSLVMVPDSSSHTVSSQNPGSAPVADPSREPLPGSLPQAGDAHAVSSAQLIQSVRHSEMRLGMQSEEFGSMSISTSLGRQALSAQISTEHVELGRTLAIHLPAMEQKLSTAYGVLAKVEVNSGTSSPSTSADTSSGQRPQGGQQQGSSRNVPSLSTSMAVTVTTAHYPAEASAITASSRLDIRV